MDAKSVSAVNFDELFRSNGFFTKDEEGNEILDDQKLKDEIGISAANAKALIEGYYNPLRGKVYKNVMEYFELDVAATRAFLRWRASKWQAWEDAGYPEEGPIANFSDSDFAGEFYDEELEAITPAQEEEVAEEESSEEESSEEASDDEDFTL